MSSILTNSSAMVALQTLKTINTGLSKTQNEISTGKSIASAKDNAAIWSIAKVTMGCAFHFRGENTGAASARKGPALRYPQDHRERIRAG